MVRCDLNPEILKHKIVHALACQSGKKLAPKCIEIGTTAYIGYKEDFQLVTLGKTTSSEQSQDAVAALFLDPAFEVVVALIKGATVEEAFKCSQIKYRENLLPLLTSSGQSVQVADVASLLAYNFQHQICIGDKTARF